METRWYAVVKPRHQNDGTRFILSSDRSFKTITNTEMAIDTAKARYGDRLIRVIKQTAQEVYHGTS